MPNDYFCMSIYTIYIYIYIYMAYDMVNGIVYIYGIWYASLKDF